MSDLVDRLLKSKFLSSDDKDLLCNNAAREIMRLQADLRHLEATFRHPHVANQEAGDDTCIKCGLDLRNNVHLGVFGKTTKPELL